MGNRAIITTRAREMGVYLHWNGGRSSVEAFLAYCKLKRYRAPSDDAPYGFARLAQVIANFFGGALSVGVVRYSNDEAMRSGLDNGVYVIEGWHIVERIYPYDGFIEASSGDLTHMLHAIDRQQPINEQLGDIIDAPVMSPDELDHEDKVWMYTDYRRVNGRYQGGFVAADIIGLGSGFVNGVNVEDVPFVGLFSSEQCPARENINNYLLEPSYHVIAHD